MRELNFGYRDVDEETDVLSFPLWETENGFEPPAGWDEIPLGDVVISPEYVLKEAETGNIDYNHEIILVMVHGVLHLIGYDHDTKDREDEMFALQNALVRDYFLRVGGDRSSRDDR
jgi:probable rRNA maturation factor